MYLGEIDRCVGFRFTYKTDSTILWRPPPYVHLEYAEICRLFKHSFITFAGLEFPVDAYTAKRMISNAASCTEN